MQLRVAHRCCNLVGKHREALGVLFMKISGSAAGKVDKSDCLPFYKDRSPYKRTYLLDFGMLTHWIIIFDQWNCSGPSCFCHLAQYNCLLKRHLKCAHDVLQTPSFITLITHCTNDTVV